jgi:midasin
LLEGPTSSGKTSVVKFLAELTGNKCVRINNHHHTDVEEYIGKLLSLGTYLPDNKGRLVFTEGVLVEALKNGHWIILDELNLARSEILESLNRLLDDNKELFINETQEYIKPAPGFRIFATQNPTSYGGRKELSKAFKNRYLL